jgi:predicted DNA-binding ribbon-helix-helix protein
VRHCPTIDKKAKEKKMGTKKFSVRIEEKTFNQLEKIIEKTNFTLAEIINATLYDFVNKNIDNQYKITSNYKWLKRHDKEILEDLKKE